MAKKRRIGLLGSVTSQPSAPAPAIDLYRSAEFLSARKTVEASCQSWFVLSPRHGLVAPGDWIEPYQQSIADTPEAERSEWSARILAQLEERLGTSLKGLEVEVHASPEFYEHGLLDGLKKAGAKVLLGADSSDVTPADAPTNGKAPRRTTAKASTNGDAAAESPAAAEAAPSAAKAKAKAEAGTEVEPAYEPPMPAPPKVSPAELRRERKEILDEFYALLDEQAEGIGGHWSLPDCSGDDHWPEKGVVFFFEPAELREDGATPRVVRVSTHALTPNSRARLWDRLRADRGTLGGSHPGSGNHRTSAFRRHLGRALMARDGYEEAAESWGSMAGLAPEVKEREVELEIAVSKELAKMSFVWMAVPEVEDRIAIERGAVALLSNLGRKPVDPPSADWLGHYAGEVISGAGIWNQDYTEEMPEMGLLSLLRDHLEA